MTYSRYAIYYSPEPGPFADFGARWLGWDIEIARSRTHPEIPGLPRPVEEITRTPRRYGFHATIKPPFHLAEDAREGDLLAAVKAACAVQPPVTLAGLELTRIGRFLALIPVGDTTTLSDLAATMVRVLDPFRAPATEAELARRRQRRLTPRQEAMLAQWGYPYVMEEFRFHMTLSGSLPDEDAQAVSTRLAPEFESLCGGPVTIGSLCLCGEDNEGRLSIVQRCPLSAQK